VDTRLHARLAEALCAQPVFDRGEDLEIAQRETAHVGLAEEDKLTRLHARSRPHGLLLDGRGLTVEDLARVARAGAAAELAPAARACMTASRAVVERYVSEGLPAYGLTTGLGARVVEQLSADALAEFSRHTVLGRAHSVGPPLPTDVVRAAMLIRANGLARGGAGARPEVAELLLALLERRVHPVVPSIGSIGAGDITVLSHVALVLIGAGAAELDGEVLPGDRALQRAGLAPVVLAPKDGLALISSNAVSIAWAALALLDARAALETAQAAAALSCEAFRANLSPLDPRVVDARPAPGQAECAAGLRALLDGGSLAAGGWRRLQDPLSFRCVSQVHGSLLAALDMLRAAVEPELNGSADNPLVVEDAILSTGNFFVPALALAADVVALALAQVASVAASRVARLLSAQLTDLPQNLAPAGSTGAGMAPLLKVAGALVGEIVHGAAPATLATHADEAVEDATTGAPLAASRLASMLDRFRLLVALELVVAAQAVDLAGIEALGARTSEIHARVRELAEPLLAERPLGGDVERVAAELDRIAG
jgi:histidine ammonia-lyase